MHQTWTEASELRYDFGRNLAAAAAVCCFGGGGDDLHVDDVGRRGGAGGGGGDPRLSWGGGQLRSGNDLKPSILFILSLSMNTHL